MSCVCLAWAKGELPHLRGLLTPSQPKFIERLLAFFLLVLWPVITTEEDEKQSRKGKWTQVLIPLPLYP